MKIRWKLRSQLFKKSLFKKNPKRVFKELSFYNEKVTDKFKTIIWIVLGKFFSSKKGIYLII